MSEQSKSLAVATIVPAPNTNPNSPHLATGTKVLLSDGSELEGVLSIELKASVGNPVWCAVITVLPREIPVVTADAQVDQIDITSLMSDSRQYRQTEQ
ncbi:hypothetical protein NP572_05685 [Pseudomonas putida]|uniref:hypothetical protein n=1 Tax=Pseudomonas putida TaxID=303 RepID=UPI002363F7D9|nr:hypothetical protein [Pseudomonas putida]MDD2035908.1 hypothetical protein [Pseudomonas putida]MDD2041629.1 hypothetical protein [Pseudomonas putida]